MKKMKLSIGLLITGLAVITSQAAVTVQNNETTAAEVGVIKAVKILPQNGAIKANTTSATTLQVIYSFGPLPGDIYYSGYVNAAVSSIITTGTLPTGERTGPTDARMLTRLVPEDLMSATVPFYWDVFNPTGTYINAMGGTIYTWVIESPGVGQTATLAGITVTMSNSGGNILGRTVTFTGSSVAYGPGAPGVPYNGSTPITSGPATQQIVGRVIVGTAWNSFPVNNAGDVQDVKDYIYQSPFGLTNTVSANGVSATFVLSTRPSVLTPSVVAGRLKVTATPSDDPKLYALQSSTNLATGVWIPTGSSIQAGQTIDLGLNNHREFYIRYAP